jgi:sigma-E factor negative regulatory protein RseB
MLKKLLACAALCVSQLANADNAWDMLQKTALAARELNYQGVFVYQNGSQMRSVQITHMNSNGKELTRNLVMDGQPREVFSEGSEIVIFNPKNDKVVIEKRRGQNLFPAMLPTDLNIIKASYNAVLGETELVAGREAQIIDLIPNDSLRYSYRVWSDKEFGLLLKMALSNTNKQILEQIGFTQLSMMNTHDLEWYKPNINLNKKYVMEDRTTVDRVAESWVSAHLPPGFKKIDQLKFTPPGKKNEVNQMIYSDGIATVSLFIEPVDKNVKPKIGHKTLGSTNMCANVVNGQQVIVVGEVPSETVTQISKSITFSPKP